MTREVRDSVGSMPRQRPTDPIISEAAGKTVVVTGANSGVGLATARALAGAGAEVVLAVRDERKGAEAAATIAGDTEVRRLDLADLRSVRDFAASWDGPLDVLINNAGVRSPELRRTADGFELQLGTNYLGHFALTNLLLEQISGRVVTLGSVAERAGRIDFDDLNFKSRAYKPSRAHYQSKLAIILFTAELQRRLDAVGSPVRAMGESFQHLAGSKRRHAVAVFVTESVVKRKRPLRRMLPREDLLYDFKAGPAARHGYRGPAPAAPPRAAPPRPVAGVLHRGLERHRGRGGHRRRYHRRQRRP